MKVRGRGNKLRPREIVFCAVKERDLGSNFRRPTRKKSRKARDFVSIFRIGAGGKEEKFIIKPREFEKELFSCREVKR